MQTWFRRLAAAMLLTVLPVYAAAGYYAWRLPDSYYVQTGSRLEVDTALHIAAVPTAHTVQAAVTASSAADTTSLRLFGIIPIKDVEIQEIDTPMLVPCGEPFGIKLRMDGAMVVGMERIETAIGTALSRTGSRHSDRRPDPICRRHGDRLQPVPTGSHCGVRRHTSNCHPHPQR